MYIFGKLNYSPQSANRLIRPSGAAAEGILKKTVKNEIPVFGNSYLFGCKNRIGAELWLFLDQYSATSMARSRRDLSKYMAEHTVYFYEKNNQNTYSLLFLPPKQLSLKLPKKGFWFLQWRLITWLKWGQTNCHSSSPVFHRYIL